MAPKGAPKAKKTAAKGKSATTKATAKAKPKESARKKVEKDEEDEEDEEEDYDYDYDYDAEEAEEEDDEDGGDDEQGGEGEEDADEEEEAEGDGESKKGAKNGAEDAQGSSSAQATAAAGPVDAQGSMKAQDKVAAGGPEDAGQQAGRLEEKLASVEGRLARLEERVDALVVQVSPPESSPIWQLTKSNIKEVDQKVSALEKLLFNKNEQRIAKEKSLDQKLVEVQKSISEAREAAKKSISEAVSLPARRDGTGDVGSIQEEAMKEAEKFKEWVSNYMDVLRVQVAEKVRVVGLTLSENSMNSETRKDILDSSSTCVSCGVSSHIFTVPGKLEAGQLTSGRNGVGAPVSTFLSREWEYDRHSPGRPNMKKGGGFSTSASHFFSTGKPLLTQTPFSKSSTSMPSLKKSAYC